MAKKNVSAGVELPTSGIKPPSFEKLVFLVHREVLDEDGIYNPVDGEGTCEGAFQINIHSDSEGYRELGKYFLWLAEYDVGGDPSFHQHYSGLISADGRTRLHVIVRKDDERYQNIQQERAR
jgi:hypothetical protein